ncbi:MAG TPA: hypothetical protein VML19_34490 [Verrucomicrobiae bacterium]|nr:hypothetical protein [Verrucomicrobiae bacterium]
MKTSVVARLRRCGWVLLLVGFPVAYGQQYSISTVAGGAPPPTPAAPLSTTIGAVRRVVLDSAGSVYFTSGNNVFKISGSNLSVVAGNSRPGFSGDGGPAVSARLNAPYGIALDSNGNLYIADSLNNRVRVVSPAGIINTFAGNGYIGYPGAFGDGGLATNANLQLPLGVAVDKSNNVYIADTGNNCIREVTTNGVIQTIAGDGYASYFGDTDLALRAEFNHPADVALDTNGNIYIADTSNGLIREVTVSTGIINVFAGSTSTLGYSGDNGPATSAGLIEPYAIAIDGSNNVYIAEREDGRIRVVASKTGNIYTAVGNGTLGFSGDGSSANNAELNVPSGVAVDSGGAVYIADSGNNRIRKSTSNTNGTISTIAGNGGMSYSGDGGAATKAQLYASQGVAVDASNNFYIADTGNHVVRKVTAAGTIATIAGNGTAGFGGDNGTGTSAQLNAPQGVVVDAAGNIYLADTGNSRVRKITPAGTISTYAGSGTAGFGGDGGAATSAQLNLPIGLALDSGGNLYIADYGNNVVRKVTSGGTISTVAGNGVQGYSGDGGQATKAAMNGPQAVAVDKAGNLYIADSQNSRIRVVTPAGTIATVAGTGIAGYTGDGGLATSAQIVNPSGMVVDSAGSIYISDSAAVIRKIYLNGPIFTIAGKGTLGYSGDGGLANSAQLASPTGLALDASGNVYVADTANSAIRLLQPGGSAINISAVVSGASNQTGAISPGDVLVLYGSGLGPANVVSSALNSSGKLPTSVAGTTIFFNGTPAPILYSSATQVSVIAPFEIGGPSVDVYATYQGQPSNAQTVTVSPVTPAFFTLDFSGKGQAAAVNSNGSVNGSAHAAPAGSYVSLYATGLGQTNPPGSDGAVATQPLPQPAQPVTATIGGKAATVQYAGGAPNVVQGVLQINLQIPTGLTPGANSVVITIGGVSSPAGVTIVTQ